MAIKTALEKSKTIRKVSIILCTFNSGTRIRTTLSSILRQDYPAIEVVVADGGSRDDTLSIIREYEELMREKGIELKWKSEADQGIYDAMNKGYGNSTGDVIVFFNDIFLGGHVVSKMMETLENSWDTCIGVHSDLVYIDRERVKRYWKMGNGTIWQGWMPAHPTLYLKREVYENYGLYKLGYQCSADYEFMIRVLKERKNKLSYVPEICVGMFYGGTSSAGMGSYYISFKEGHRALLENGIKSAWIIDLKRTARLLLQFIRAKKFRQIPVLGDMGVYDE